MSEFKIKNPKFTKVKFIYLLISLIMFLMLIGISYAYFTTRIEGNSNDIIINTKRLEIVYNSGPEVSLINAYPGEETTKTFNVENTSNTNTHFGVIWEINENTFLNNELVYDLYINEELISSENVITSLNQIIIPSKEILLDEKINFKIIIKFIETNQDQEYNEGAIFSGKITIVNKIS